MTPGRTRVPEERPAPAPPGTAARAAWPPASADIGASPRGLCKDDNPFAAWGIVGFRGWRSRSQHTYQIPSAATTPHRKAPGLGARQYRPQRLLNSRERLAGLPRDQAADCWFHILTSGRWITWTQGLEPFSEARTLQCLKLANIEHCRPLTSTVRGKRGRAGQGGVNQRRRPGGIHNKERGRGRVGVGYQESCYSVPVTARELVSSGAAPQLGPLSTADSSPLGGGVRSYLHDCLSPRHSQA